MADAQPKVVVASEELVGKELGGSYLILRRMAEGGMGVIYEGKHLRLPKRVVVKVMLPEIASDQVLFGRFRREAEAASSIGNPHIAAVLDFNSLPNGSPYMVMEYLEGEDLWRRLGRVMKLPPKAAARILAEAADGLMSAHTHGILHRDIKPANLFLAQQDRGPETVKLIDFGSAKLRDKVPTERLTRAGKTVGTPWYMSPEQAKGGDLDARADQWSLAVVLYESLTGKLPFTDEDPVQVLHKIVREPHTPIRDWDPTLPAELEVVFTKALAKDSRERFHSVEELAQRARALLDPESVERATLPEVEAVVDGRVFEPGVAPRDSSAAQSAAAPVAERRWSWRAPAAVGAALLLAGALGKLTEHPAVVEVPVATHARAISAAYSGSSPPLAVQPSAASAMVVAPASEIVARGAVDAGTQTRPAPRVDRAKPRAKGDGNLFENF